MTRKPKTEFPSSDPLDQSAVEVTVDETKLQDVKARALRIRGYAQQGLYKTRDVIEMMDFVENIAIPFITKVISGM